MAGLWLAILYGCIACCWTGSPTYLGCYIDAKSRALPNHQKNSDSMTREICIEHCRFLMQRYAGVQYSTQCFCGDSEDDYARYGGASEGECNKKCGGDDSQICGGTWRQSVFDLEGTSWQDYVDDQLIATKMVQQAAIIGHDGMVWATSKGFTLEPKESKVWISRFTNTEELAENGVTVGGTKYMYLSSNDRVIRAKKGTRGIHIIKTTQAFIVGLYQDPIVPEQAATVVEKLGEYLIQVGY